MIHKLFFNNFLIGRLTTSNSVYENKYYESDSISRLYLKMDKDKNIINRSMIKYDGNKYSCKQTVLIDL